MLKGQAAIKLTTPEDLKKVERYHRNLQEIRAAITEQNERHEKENAELLARYNTELLPQYIDILQPYVMNPSQFWDKGEYYVDVAYFELYGDAFIVHSSKTADQETSFKRAADKTVPLAKHLN